MASVDGYRPLQGASDEDRQAALARAIAEVEGSEGPRAIIAYLLSLAPFTSSLVVAAPIGGEPSHLFDDISAERRPIVVDAFMRGAYLLDPFYARIAPGLGTTMLTLRDVQPDHFRKTEYFRNYYSDARLVDEIGLFVELPDGSYVFYSLGRAYGRQGFSRQERQRLAQALPVVEALSRRQWGGERGRGGRKRGSRISLEAALESNRFSVLTPREREITALVLKGHSSKSIARETGISPGTVNIHRKHVYTKLGITSQGELFNLFMQMFI